MSKKKNNDAVNETEEIVEAVNETEVVNDTVETPVENKEPEVKEEVKVRTPKEEKKEEKKEESPKTTPVATVVETGRVYLSLGVVNQTRMEAIVKKLEKINLTCNFSLDESTNITYVGPYSSREEALEVRKVFTANGIVSRIVEK